MRFNSTSSLDIDPNGSNSSNPSGFEVSGAKAGGFSDVFGPAVAEGFISDIVVVQKLTAVNLRKSIVQIQK
jgi:hypothetical protein